MRIFTPEAGILELLPTDEPYRLLPEELAVLEKEAHTPEEGPPAEAKAPWAVTLGLLGDISGKSTLDLCCGSGWAGAEFARAGARVAIADALAGKNGLTYAGTRAIGSGTMDLFQVDAVRIPFAPETFDIVFIGSAIHRMKRPERVMKEASRVLKPDGIVINICEPVGSGGVGISDPRREGRTLNLADYKAIYREAGLELTVHPLDKTARPGGVFSRLFHRNETPGVFTARHIPGFQMPEMRLPWKKKKET